MKNDRLSRRSLLMLMVGALLIVPIAAYAGSVFNDVDDTNTHIDGITFAKTSGVSVGCDANNNYCPKNDVTRAQMATFMYRLSGTDPLTPPSVNAASVGGFAANELVRAAYSQVSTDLDNWDGTLFTDSTVLETTSAGLVILNYTVNIGPDDDATAITDQAYFLIPRIDGTAASGTALESLAFGTMGDESWTVQRIIVVDADEHIIAVDVGRTGGADATALAYIYDRSLSALFIPYDGSGASPLSLGISASDSTDLFRQP